ncbi:MAG: hypothetical protein ACHREM_31725 [Polyangiales bacterium]
MTTVVDDLDDDFLSQLMRGAPAAPSVPWPPANFFPRAWEHPVVAWVDALHAHTASLAADTYVFPAALTVQPIEHRGTRRHLILIGLRAHSGEPPPKMGRVPVVGTDGAWGGVVQIDGRQLADCGELMAPGDYGGRAAVVSYEHGIAGTLTTLAVALVARESMVLKRHVVGREGRVVSGSTETWVVEGGAVRRIG